jgi:hypothetical protein
LNIKVFRNTGITISFYHPEVIYHHIICSIIRDIVGFQVSIVCGVNIELSILGSTDVQGTDAEEHAVLVLVSISRIEGCGVGVVGEFFLSTYTPEIVIVIGAGFTEQNCGVADVLDSVVLVGGEGVLNGGLPTGHRTDNIEIVGDALTVMYFKPREEDIGGERFSREESSTGSGFFSGTVTFTDGGAEEAVIVQI